MLEPSYLADLETRIVDRAKDEWVGVHVTPRKSFLAPPVRDGGASEALIKLTARIAVDEINKF